MVVVPETVLQRYAALSLYNSPYRAHEEGRAIDLYPATGAPSPVAGTVVTVERVRAPPKPYAPEHDYLLGIDTGAGPDGPTYRTPEGAPAVARILHVDPEVAVGDPVAAGDRLGEPIRAGFFAPWVDWHLHLGFRRPGEDLLRASGSLRVVPGADVRPVEWDGRGTVVEASETDAVLDRPEHPAPGAAFAAIAGELHPRSGDEGAHGPDGTGRVGRPVPVDGGLPHYDAGGAFGDGAGQVSFLGTAVGTLDSRTVAWGDVTVHANGSPIHGLSLSASRDRTGAKLICPDASFAVGESVRVAVRR